jgi:hypothetical protein
MGILKKKSRVERRKRDPKTNAETSNRKSRFPSRTERERESRIPFLAYIETEIEHRGLLVGAGRTGFVHLIIQTRSEDV